MTFLIICSLILALAAGVWIKTMIDNYGFNKAYEQLKREYNGKR